MHDYFHPSHTDNLTASIHPIIDQQSQAYLRRQHPTAEQELHHDGRTDFHTQRKTNRPTWHRVFDLRAADVQLPRRYTPRKANGPPRRRHTKDRDPDSVVGACPCDGRPHRPQCRHQKRSRTRLQRQENADDVPKLRTAKRRQRGNPTTKELVRHHRE